MSLSLRGVLLAAAGLLAANTVTAQDMAHSLPSIPSQKAAIQDNCGFNTDRLKEILPIDGVERMLPQKWNRILIPNNEQLRILYNVRSDDKKAEAILSQATTLPEKISLCQVSEMSFKQNIPVLLVSSDNKSYQTLWHWINLMIN